MRIPTYRGGPDKPTVVCIHACAFVGIVCVCGYLAETQPGANLILEQCLTKNEVV